MLHIMRARARVRRPAAGYVENVVALEASPFASNPLAAVFFGPPRLPGAVLRQRRAGDGRFQNARSVAISL